MPALPIFLDSLVAAWGAILISVTLILLFGEIIPQAVCSRYGLAIGAKLAPFVRVLVWICFPVAYPISKVKFNFSLPCRLVLLNQEFDSSGEYLITGLVLHQLLDFLLGEGHDALFRRAELKTLVDLHGNEVYSVKIISRIKYPNSVEELDRYCWIIFLCLLSISFSFSPVLTGLQAGKGGELTRDETTIIAGALELAEKTARDAMTPISETFAIDVNDKLDRDLMRLILEKGHSRVPVYYQHPRNIIGLILVKNLLPIHPEDEVPVKNVTIRKIPRVQETMPLYDILNEFQKGHSHMAVVVKQKNDVEQQANENSTDALQDVRVDIDGEKHPVEKCLRSKRSLKKAKSLSYDINAHKGGSRSKKWSRDFHSDILQINHDDGPLLVTTGQEEAIGIITLEDVIEELLQEEIFDETDYRDES
ncbi:DUF21 domain-containing protein At2g14520-like isoform X5 [Carica papaya]|uniref:DUF21 domain-containing protein At2g14520-like isoform X5 n=1 Tax=Carica papaya TaxID=3649 RepID=UPI000B8C71C6|nr:DUF21 domain-containing protein At2g14520-like isoform X5 [Carica papaya]